MRLALLLCLLSLPALAQDASGAVRRWSFAEATTQGEPAVSCFSALGSEGGMDLRSVRSYQVMVEADVGQTFTGAGSIVIYYYDFIYGWFPAVQLSKVMTAASGVRKAAFAADIAPLRTGCLFPGTLGVGVTGGGVTVRVTAWTGAQ